MADTHQTIGEQVIELAETIASTVATNIDLHVRALNKHEDRLNNHDEQIDRLYFLSSMAYAEGYDDKCPICQKIGEKYIHHPNEWFRHFYNIPDFPEYPDYTYAEIKVITADEWKQLSDTIEELNSKIDLDTIENIGKNTDRITALETHETAEDNEWATRDFLKAFQDSIEKD